jgi:two-component system, NtrC family, nitrogen regulation sensor histidine kinase GlnL
MAAAAPAPVAAAASIDLFQSHPVASLLIDARGLIIDANQEAEALLVRSRSHLLGQGVSKLVRGSKRDSLARVLSDPAATARLFGVELATSQRPPVFADIVLGTGQGGEGVRLLALHQVPQSTRDSHLRPGAAARSASAAAAMLAHEIKNPLSGIRGAAQLLGRQASDSGKPLADLICGEVDRIAALIDSMQGFTRGAPLKVEPLNIFPAISQAREIAEAGFAADAQFDEWFDPSIPPIRANHDALVQVLINLIKNAREAAAPGHRATIRLTTGYRHGFAWDAGDGQGHVALPIELCVMDDGPGVPDSLGEALFDPFVSGKKDGQGLGLALVDKLMRDMGGLVQHDRVDGWTRFRLCFRAAPAGRGGEA